MSLHSPSPPAGAYRNMCCGGLVSFGARGAWRSRAGTRRCMLVLIPLQAGARRRSGRRKRTKRRGAGNSTDDLLARAALDAGPIQRKDLSAEDVARRARSGSTASQATRTPPWKRTTSAVRATRHARRYAGSQLRRRRIPRPSSKDSLGVGAPGAAQRHTCAVLHLSASGPAPDALAHLQAAEDEDAAHLDGLAYARLAPRPVGGSQSQSRSSGRSSGSGSGAPPYSPVGEIGYVGMPNQAQKANRNPNGAKSKSSALPPPPARPRRPAQHLSHTGCAIPRCSRGVRRVRGRQRRR
ncbi:hypothetical protein B0H14DRAFT_675847 [Mycena olivaceomarginata]|nr:hypothetical protein B0H14DRAFT_675847 [Mycena olivaceomarginata]